MEALFIATSQKRLADVDLQLRHYEDAVRLYERAQPVLDKNQYLWEDRYADFLGNLAESYWRVGRYSEAEARLKQALQLQEKTFGSDALSLVSTLNTLAYFYYDREEDEVAEPFAQRSIAICKSRLGAKSSCTADSLSMLSLVFDGEGKFTQAESLAREALPTLEDSVGAQSYDVASTLNRLGLALEGQRRWPEAEATFSKALAIREQLSGAQSHDLVVILHNLSRLYSEEGRKRDAAAFRKRADDISSSAPPAKSTEIKQPTPQIGRRPTGGSINGNIYTNSFFQFSLPLPKGWKVLSTDSAAAVRGGGSAVQPAQAPADVLLMVGNVDTRGTRWITIAASHLASASSNITAEDYLKREAYALKVASSLESERGQTPWVTPGEPTEISIQGRRMARLDMTGHVDNYTFRGSQLATIERGYRSSPRIPVEMNPTTKQPKQ